MRPGWWPPSPPRQRPAPRAHDAGQGTTDDLESFAPILDLSQIARPNAEGTLDARFWVAPGDDHWLLGPREGHGWSRTVPDPADFTPERTHWRPSCAATAAAASCPG